MKIATTFFGFFLFAYGSCVAQTSQPNTPRGLFDTNALKPDVRTFELSPRAPSTPVMNYELRYDNPFERRAGNAAVQYLDAIIILRRDGGGDKMDKVDDAMEAYTKGDMATFDKLADAVNIPGLFPILDLAARSDNCDWETPLREMGYEAMLPNINDMRSLNEFVVVRALGQMEGGKTDDALATLRMGYGVCDGTGRTPMLISKLVAVGETIMMNDTLSLLISRADAPNLYWSMSTALSAKSMLGEAMESEWGMILNRAIPGGGPVLANGNLSPNQWRQAFDYLNALIVEWNRNSAQPAKVDPVSQTTPQVLQMARNHYVQVHGTTAESPDIVAIGEYYLWQYESLLDDLVKLRGLSYPQMLARQIKINDRIKQMRVDEPANPLVFMVPINPFVAWRCAWVDRQWAALTAIEAISAYAAADGGKLPTRLEDVIETPVPNNPATDKPFEYKVSGDTVTLSDTASQQPMVYTIKIRN
jgi:hypothetical protein